MNHGFILIDKPTGITSFGALKAIDKHFSLSRKGIKYGHGGTLDPDASGLLVMAFGRSTRLLRFFQGSTKAYRAQIKLGERTDTDDASGSVTASKPWCHVTSERVVTALDRFRGEIMQVPPVFSAVHVNGKRAYDLARAGRDVSLAPRPVTIYDIALTDCQLPQSPVLSLDIQCSGGTYIRSLARDLGEALGTCAHMCALRRTQSCHFCLDQAHELQFLLNQPSPEPYIIPAFEAMRQFPIIRLNHNDLDHLMSGRKVDFSDMPAGIYVICAKDSDVLQAIVEISNDISITRINT